MLGTNIVKIRVHKCSYLRGKMKKALVTGGAGFIGSHLCERLLKNGYFVYCVDNLYTGYRNNINHLINDPFFEFINSDICTLSDLEIDEIYNLACPASPKHYQINPLFTIQTCVNGVIHLANLAQKLKIKIFQASTSEVYGEPLVHPQPENYWGNVNTIGPRACYDEGKRIAETILFSYHEQHPYPLKVGRIFNTYGPHMNPDDGRVISSFITQALANKDITIFGEGKQTRSFCFIDDLLDAILIFMHTENDITGPLNLGSEFEHEVIAVAKLIIKLTNSNSKLIYLPMPKDDPSRRRPDLNLTKKILGWAPKVTLEEGIQRTIPYYKDWPNAFVRHISVG